jgi:transaldolase
MALYLDSADVEDARRVAGLGFVVGVTTNPALVQRTGRPAEHIVADLCSVVQGTVFHQVTSRPGAALEAEIERFLAISKRVAFKIPCTLAYMPAVYLIREEGKMCAVTGVFSAAQALISAEAGARYVIPYVNRATRLCGDGLALVAAIRTVLEGRECEILAASIKSAEEAVSTVGAGAHHLTLPWEVLSSLAEHPLTRQAMEEFAAVVR